MSNYRIICTSQEPVGAPNHQAHIVAVGTGVSPTNYERKCTVAEVYAAIDRGDGFFTSGEQSGKSAWVTKWSCTACSRATLRSAPDSVPDNNLDNLPNCG